MKWLILVPLVAILMACGGDAPSGSTPTPTPQSDEKSGGALNGDEEITVLGETKTVSQFRAEEGERIATEGAGMVCGSGVDFIRDLISDPPTEDERKFLEIMAELCEEAGRPID